MKQSTSRLWIDMVKVGDASRVPEVIGYGSDTG